MDLQKTQMVAEGLAKLKYRARQMTTKQFNMDNGWIDDNRQQCGMCVASNNPFFYCMFEPVTRVLM